MPVQFENPVFQGNDAGVNIFNRVAADWSADRTAQRLAHIKNVADAEANLLKARVESGFRMPQDAQQAYIESINREQALMEGVGGYVNPNGEWQFGGLYRPVNNPAWANTKGASPPRTLTGDSGQELQRQIEFLKNLQEYSQSWNQRNPSGGGQP
jgi:hypothetical protein